MHRKWQRNEESELPSGSHSSAPNSFANKFRAAASDPQRLATDLADYLVKKGMPFRQAHHVGGVVVGFAEQAGRPLDQVTVAEFQKISPQFGADVAAVFHLDAAMQCCAVIGAPGTKEVKKQLARSCPRLISCGVPPARGAGRSS